jgi:hypothetical protein
MLSGSGEKLADAAGTPAFMAPELCDKRDFSGQLADIWAMGATIYMLRFGHPPFIAKSIIHLFSKICHEPLGFPGPIEAELKQLLECMLEKDPVNRISMQALAMHSWLQKPPPMSSRSVPRSLTASHTTRPSTSTAVTALVLAKSAVAGTKADALFQPPPSYDEEEAAAMREKIKISDLNNIDLFMSIGGIRVENSYEEIEVVEDFDDDDDDDDDELEAEPKKRSGAANTAVAAAAALEMVKEKKKEDIMGTNWGADVFQMVDDDGSNDDEDEDVDEEKVNGPENLSIPTKVKREAAAGLQQEAKSDLEKNESRHEMSHEEEMRRSRQFMKKIARKSAENVRAYTEPRTTTDVLLAASILSPSTKGLIADSKPNKEDIRSKMMLRGERDSSRLSMEVLS